MSTSQPPAPDAVQLQAAVQRVRPLCARYGADEPWQRTVTVGRVLDALEDKGQPVAGLPCEHEDAVRRIASALIDVVSVPANTPSPHRERKEGMRGAYARVLALLTGEDHDSILERAYNAHQAQEQAEHDQWVADTPPDRSHHCPYSSG